ncbi:MAG: SufD family Fe-S cluster assembly protein, partial [Bacteroidaceae bacterium]|nr:SufD family Fe-S cluster assembly protein [Bacteroidaceae bacterium]
MKNNQYVEFYTQVRDTIRQRSCPVMNAHRDEAFSTFSAIGFPTQKVERYKYTDVAQDFAPDYGIQLSSTTGDRTEFCCSLKDAPIDVAPYYNSIANKQDAVVALNTMLAVDALLVYVPKGIKAKHPIQINNTLKGKQDTMINRRILILMEEGAEADIIITDHAADHQQFLTNQVVEVFCQDNSHLNLYEIEETNLMCTRYSNVFIHEGRDCSVRHTSLTIFNGHTRNTCHVQMVGEHSEVTLHGCVIADKMQRVDNNTCIEHMVPNCQSRELYKYILDDSAIGAFAGMIHVHKDAQKTSSSMTNANLCATRQSRMYTQPMLEIYADDVKCSHGSTVGQLNDQALLYMRQRGISLSEAQLLL